MELQFLTDSNAVKVFSAVAHSIIAQDPNLSIDFLTPVQIEKVRTTIKFLADQPQEERQQILSSVQCPDAENVTAVINAFAKALKSSEPNHQLRDFDWSVSLVLGTSQVSNVKEPLCTFKFDVNEVENGKTVVKSHNIELSLNEAQQLLAQLQAARNAQRDILQK